MRDLWSWGNRSTKKYISTPFCSKDLVALSYGLNVRLARFAAVALWSTCLRVVDRYTCDANLSWINQIETIAPVAFTDTRLPGGNPTPSQTNQPLCLIIRFSYISVRFPHADSHRLVFPERLHFVVTAASSIKSVEAVFSVPYLPYLTLQLDLVKSMDLVSLNKPLSGCRPHSCEERLSSALIGCHFFTTFQRLPIACIRDA